MFCNKISLHICMSNAASPKYMLNLLNTPCQGLLKNYILIILNLTGGNVLESFQERIAQSVAKNRKLAT
jgi:hypothetical protein